MIAIPWKWAFAGAIALIIVNYFSGILPTPVPAAVFVLLLVVYFLPKIWKRELVMHSLSWCDNRVREWALKERGKRFVELIAFQDAVRMDGIPVFEILYEDSSKNIFRVEVNKRTGDVSRFVSVVTIDREQFLTTNEVRRFRHLRRRDIRELYDVKNRPAPKARYEPPPKEETEKKETREE